MIPLSVVKVCVDTACEYQQNQSLFPLTVYFLLDTKLLLRALCHLKTKDAPTQLHTTSIFMGSCWSTQMCVTFYKEPSPSDHISSVAPSITPLAPDCESAIDAEC